jgi:SAM-dependent methyltransferase
MMPSHPMSHRPTMATVLKRSVRDQIARFGLAEPAFQLYSLVTRLDPRSVRANARFRREGAADGLPIPPPELIFLVAGTSNISWFLEVGKRAADSITEALAAAEVDIERLDAILDFGCGCGRVIRHWHTLPRTKVFGTDYNPRLIEWCRTNLAFATFSINQLAPPLGWDDSAFDLVYALSVFTHLTADLQVSWMDELARIVKPGGHLIISTHGDMYEHRLDGEERRLYAAGQLVVKNDTRAPGQNTCSAYHPQAYVRGALAASRFDVVQFIPEGARGNPRQDLYVLRKPRHAAMRLA